MMCTVSNYILLYTESSQDMDLGLYNASVSAFEQAITEIVNYLISCLLHHSQSKECCLYSFSTWWTNNKSEYKLQTG